MSQATEMGVGLKTMDPFEIGWYIDSADEDTYGPVSRAAIRRFLEDGTITPNTLVRHCTQPETRPAAEQPLIVNQLDLQAKGLAVGDRLAEAWPRKKRDRLALAGDSLACAWHKRPAVLVCLRCHAPYCNACRAKPLKKQYFLCRRCQAGMHNRRFVALILDTGILIYLPLIAMVAAVTFLVKDPNQMLIIINIAQLPIIALMFFRDSLFGGRGIGKRLTGLRVVQSKDGTTPLTYGQGIVRWLSQFIPFFNLLDAIAPYRDPLFRRYGDRWAKTQVLDTQTKLAKDRAKIARRLIKKGVQPPPEFGMTMEGLARLA